MSKQETAEEVSEVVDKVEKTDQAAVENVQETPPIEETAEKETEDGLPRRYFYNDEEIQDQMGVFPDLTDDQILNALSQTISELVNGRITSKIVDVEGEKEVHVTFQKQMTTNGG